MPFLFSTAPLVHIPQSDISEFSGMKNNPFPPFDLKLPRSISSPHNGHFILSFQNIISTSFYLVSRDKYIEYTSIAISPITSIKFCLITNTDKRVLLIHEKHCRQKHIQNRISLLKREQAIYLQSRPDRAFISSVKQYFLWFIYLYFSRLISSCRFFKNTPAWAPPICV